MLERNDTLILHRTVIFTWKVVPGFHTILVNQRHHPASHCHSSPGIASTRGDRQRSARRNRQNSGSVLSSAMLTGPSGGGPGVFPTKPNDQKGTPPDNPNRKREKNMDRCDHMLGLPGETPHQTLRLVKNADNSSVFRFCVAPKSLTGP